MEFPAHHSGIHDFLVEMGIDAASHPRVGVTGRNRELLPVVRARTKRDRLRKHSASLWSPAFMCNQPPEPSSSSRTLPQVGPKSSERRNCQELSSRLPIGACLQRAGRTWSP